jgi:branched-chain amino acid transport system ATP-binding protein
MLKCVGLSASYGDVTALRGVDLCVNEGEAVALLGANGAGKTTLLRAISGVVKTEGDVIFEGQSICRVVPEKRARKGIAHVPEGRRIFAGLTVRENLEVGDFASGERRRRGEDLERVYGLFPRLCEREKQLGWSLSGGEQQMLAIGRALMGSPRMLLLDEPSLGLAPRLAEEVYAQIASVTAWGMTVLLVEQNTVLALEVASRGYVLDGGSLVMEGSAHDLRADSRVREAYLGH